MKSSYNLVKSTIYALAGIKTMWCDEISFRIELLVGLTAIFISFFLPVTLTLHLLLIMSILLIFIAEAINSAIENTVDMVTGEFNSYAKKAKDTAAAAVFFSIIFACIVWAAVLYSLLK